MSPVEGITVTANSSVIGNTNTLGELEVNAAGLDSVSIYQQGYIPVSVQPSQLIESRCRQYPHQRP